MNMNTNNKVLTLVCFDNFFDLHNYTLMWILYQYIRGYIRIIEIQIPISSSNL